MGPVGCQRNGRALRVGAAESFAIGKAKAKTSNASCEALISALAVAHPQILRHELDAWVEAIRTGECYLSVNDDLPAVLHQCQNSANSSLRSQFLSMLGRVQLAFKCRR